MKKTLAFILLAAMAFTMLAGCGDDAEIVNTPEMTDFLVAEKIGTINGISNVSPNEAGITSYVDGKYAILSYEGVYNSGAIYESADYVGSFYKVAVKEPTDLSDAAAQNCKALVDNKGRVIAPAIYADFRTTGSDRYIVAITATELTFIDDDNALCKNYKNGGVNSMFKGTWCVYDTTTGKIVPGISGNTKPFPTATYGDYLSVNSANGYFNVDWDGNVVASEGRSYFDDGSYYITNSKSEMFDKFGTKIFDIDPVGYIPMDISEDYKYYVASKYENGASTYVVMDRTGNTVSTVFNDYITIEGEIISCNNELFNFAGKKLVEGEYFVLVDQMIGQYYYISEVDDYEEYKFIDLEGNIYVDGEEDDDEGSYTDYLTAYKVKDDGERYFYCFKDKDYTIKGSYGEAPWLVTAETANYRYNVVDTMSGTTLIAGYENYDFYMRNDYLCYVYAQNDDATDVYMVIANSKVAEIREKKAKLLNELIAAFNSAGITVNVNQETGELAMDTNVIFAPDSAELTAAGKEFLNKFIKVYTNVAFTNEYEGFITKTLVEGHAAPVAGSSLEQSIPLSEQRAANVRDYCLSAETGVNVDKIRNRLEATGYGNAQPVYYDNGEVNMDASRRVAFKFLVAVSVSGK